MKLIVGLGNPGKKYEGTRHNVGFVAIDRLTQMVEGNCVWKSDSRSQADLCTLPSSDVVLVKPQTFMNDSGKAVNSLATYYKLSAANIYVIHDDLDIKLGEYKIQKGKGPKDHRGIQSIEEKMGTKDFWRVRIGVENRASKKIVGEDYVLMQFTVDETPIINSVVDKVITELKYTIDQK